MKPYNLTKRNTLNSLAAILILLLNFSCKKFVAVDPPVTRVVSDLVFSSDATANASIRGIYSEMMNSTFTFSSGGNQSITFLAGLSADEFINTEINSSLKDQIYTNSILPSNSIPYGALWEKGYKFIYYANLILEETQKSQALSPAVKTQLTGEALFIRSFCYFYLVNMFGDVPLATTSDYRTNNVLPRAPQQEIYQLIIEDLKLSKDLLKSDYSISAGERTRPNKWAASVLLARVYLFTEDWKNAEIQATEIIDNSGMFSLTSLSNVFLKNNLEAIWQLKPVLTTTSTFEANDFIPASPSTAPLYVSLTADLIASFESNDNRYNEWVKSNTVNGMVYYYPYKYKNRSATASTEYSVVFRLAEQYLIRAETKARQEKITESKSDLDVIRQRAGLQPSIANTKEALLTAIAHERRIEFFAEWGHRWLDLKRTAKADEVLGLAKAPNWEPTDVLYPIPQSEIDVNSRLSQNAGY